MIYDNIQKAVSFIKPYLHGRVETALILGSGLGGLADDIKGISIPFHDVPGVLSSTAPQHKGAFKIGRLEGRNVMAMQGRLHMYEGYSPAELVFPVQIMVALGARQMIITNAAGGIGPHFQGGEIGLIEDHINLPGMTGNDPLRGLHDAHMGGRFTSMNGAYSKRLIHQTQVLAEKLNITAKRGVYAYAAGPSLETPAEIRMLRMFGAHMVGMSTVPEVIAARQMGCEILALSAVSNLCIDDVNSGHVTCAEDVYKAMETLSPKLHRLIKALLPSFPS